MAFTKGSSGNPNGRPRCSENKNPLRDLVTRFVLDNWQQVEADFKGLEPKDRLQFFEKLLKYSLPTLQSVNVTNALESQLEALSDEQLEHLMNNLYQFQLGLA